MISFTPFWKLLPATILNELDQYGAPITTNLRALHFLAQIDFESGGFRRIEENLNYTAARLPVVFGRKRFPPDVAKQVEHDSEAIGNIAYANRLGNGDAESGDGYRYRGRGYIQLTGKDNYRAFSEWSQINVVDYPDLVASHFPTVSAIWFFTHNKIWDVCDRGSSEEIIAAVTKKVNGGYNGLESRVRRFAKYRACLK